MKAKIKTLSNYLPYLPILLALCSCVGQPVEPVATTQVPQQGTHTEAVENQATETLK